MCSSIFSQQLADYPVIEKFRSYAGKAIQEKLFLHTDKEFYVAGEIAWFRIYYVDGSTHKPLQVSKVAYVEILNDRNESVQQAKISLLPGESSGSFYLPTSLTTGYYTVRAYTNWMKNFDAGYFFEKKIALVNTLKSAESITVSERAPSVSVQFFPEGGNLVSGIESKIGFIISDDRGGIDSAKGYIIDNNKDTVASFNPLKFGLGNFQLKPVAGNTYNAAVVVPGRPALQQALPEIYDQGYVMSLKEDNQDQLVVTVWKRAAQGNREQLMLAAHTRQVLKVVERAPIDNNGSTRFLVDKNKLGEGVTHFILFNEAGKPVCERLFYKKPAEPVALQIGKDKQVYGKRQPVDLSITAAGNAGANMPLDLSAAVFYLDTLQQQERSTIVDYMWLSSDLGTQVGSPAYYFSTDPNVAAATDNLMLTNGWRRFKWEDIWKESDAFIKYMPEMNGHLVTGRVRDTRDGKAAAGINAYLSVSGQPFGFYTARSDTNGIVKFEIKRYYGNSQIIAQPGMGADSFYRVDILKPFAGPPAGKKYVPYPLTEEIKQQLLRRSIGMQVQNIYAGDSLKTFINPFMKDTLPFFGLPENTYRLDDYKRFTTMEEVLREYVREIGVGSRHDQLIFKIFNPAAHDFYDGSELLLLDGVALTNVNRIFAYDPMKVKKIDVIRSRYILGPTTFNGVASFTTYDGKFDGFELDPRLVEIDYNGLQLQREFYSPVYETKQQLENRLPDFRNTLYWNSDIHAKGKTVLRFYSSDLPGTYTIVVQGMNESGDFVSATTTFEVK